MPGDGGGAGASPQKLAPRAAGAQRTHRAGQRRGVRRAPIAHGDVSGNLGACHDFDLASNARRCGQSGIGGHQDRPELLG